MSTLNAPNNRSRSKKIDTGRSRYVVYLPKEEGEFIQQIMNTTGASQSNALSKIYYQGKQQIQASKYKED